MSVRLKLALTILATGFVTALLVIATVLFAFQRLEREMTFQRATSFLMRITSTYDDVRPGSCLALCIAASTGPSATLKPGASRTFPVLASTSPSRSSR